MKPPRKTPKPIKRPPASPRQVLRVLLPGLDAKADWTLIGTPQRSRQAHVYRARAAGWAPDVAVKIYHQLLHPQQPRWQYEALLASFAAMSGPRFSVVRPLGLLKDEHTLFMDWVEGTPLSGKLWTWKPIVDARRKAVLADAGGWLRCYHEANGIAIKPFEPETVLRWIDRPFAADPPLERMMMANALFADTLARLRRLAESVKGTPVAHTAVHGDFTPYNLLETGERLVGIDILALHDQPALSDLSRFLVYADVRKYPFTLMAQMNPLGVRSGDAEALLGGYGLSLAEATAPVAMAVHLAEVLRRWARVGQKVMRGGRKTMLWQHEAWRMRRMVRRIAGSLDGIGA